MWSKRAWFFARRSATRHARPAITERAASLLKGERADVVEAGMIFLPAGAPHGTLGPLSPNVQQAC